MDRQAPGERCSSEGCRPRGTQSCSSLGWATRSLLRARRLGCRRSRRLRRSDIDHRGGDRDRHSRGGTATATVAAATATAAPPSPVSSPVVGGICTLTPVAFDPDSIDLTGAWAGNDGGIYDARQLDSVIWWNGMSSRNEEPTLLGRRVEQRWPRRDQRGPHDCLRLGRCPSRRGRRKRYGRFQDRCRLVRATSKSPRRAKRAPAEATRSGCRASRASPSKRPLSQSPVRAAPAPRVRSVVTARRAARPGIYSSGTNGRPVVSADTA